MGEQGNTTTDKKTCGKDNLVLLGDDPERDIEIQRAGGIASGLARRRKRSMKDTLKMLMELKVTDEEELEHLKAKGVADEDADQHTLMMLSMVDRLIEKGDPQVATFIRDTIGEREADKLEISQPIKLDIDDDYGE